MTEKDYAFYDSWYRCPITDETSRCTLNNKICKTDSCRECEIAKTYEASPNANYKP